MISMDFSEQRILSEALRYLGYQGKLPDSQTKSTLQKMILELRELAEGKFIYRQFAFSLVNNEVQLANGFLTLPGESIKKHLEDSKTCILMAVSLGHQVDKKIRYYEKVELSKAIILDACATAACEDLANRVCLEIKQSFLSGEQNLTSRFSPGYGDLPLEVQGEFIRTLDAQRQIGLTTTPSSILIPRKSITSVMGVTAMDVNQNYNNCPHCCKNSSCNFRKGELNDEPKKKIAK